MTWKARWYSLPVIFSFLCLLQSCEGNSSRQKQNTDTTTKQDSFSTFADNGILKFQNIVGESGLNSRSIGVGDMVSYVAGTFLYTGKLDTAYVVKVKQGKGTSAEDGIADGYELRFTGSDTKAEIGCCEVRIINEGDLNSDGKEELSLYQYPPNGCTIFIHTLKIGGHKCTEIIEPFLFPAVCEPIPDRTIHGLVALRGGSIFISKLVDSTINGSDTFVQVMQEAAIRH